MKPDIIVLIALSMIIAGCGAIKRNVPIQEPTDGLRARVRLMVPPADGGYHGVFGYPNRTCVDLNAPGGGNILSGQTIGFEKHLNGQTIGMPITENSQNTKDIQGEIFTVAGQPITLRFFKANSSGPRIEPNLYGTGFISTYERRDDGCIASFSFVPEAGADYEIGFFGQCAYTVNQLVKSASEHTPLASLIPINTDKTSVCRR